MRVALCDGEQWTKVYTEYVGFIQIGLKIILSKGLHEWIACEINKAKIVTFVQIPRQVKDKHNSGQRNN